ncbi:MAG: recombinase family protein [Flavobacteriales bacterium]
MRQAMNEGRYMYKPPLGFANRQNGREKWIEPDEHAKHMRWAFEQLSTGMYTVEEVRKKLNQQGCTISSSPFHRNLRNPVYAGKVKIPEWQDEPEEIVQGRHEGIVSEELFQLVQDFLNGRMRGGKPKYSKQEGLPLRGFLQCPRCGNSLTGSYSTSRGNKFPYYHCQVKYGCKERVPANAANDNFIKYLDQFQFKEEVLNLYYQVLEEVFERDSDERLKRVKELQKAIEEKEEMIDGIVDARVLKEIDQATFDRTRKRYEKKKKLLDEEKQALEFEHSGFMESVRYGFGLLTNLPNYYQNSPVEIKHKILGSIFPSKLVYENEKYRTEQLNEVLALIGSDGKGFGGIKKGRKVKFDNPSSMVARRGFEPLLPG